MEIIITIGALLLGAIILFQIIKTEAFGFFLAGTIIFGGAYLIAGWAGVIWFGSAFLIMVGAIVLWWLWQMIKHTFLKNNS